MKGKAANVIRHLARSTKVLPQRSRRLLYDALVCPHLGYADVVWDGCGKEQKVELQRIHNFAAKVVAGADRYTPSNEVLRNLGMVPLTAKREIHQAVFMHKLVNGRGPAELCNRVQENMNNQLEGLRSKTSLLITPQQHRTAKYEKSTLWRATKAWNRTSKEIRLIDDTSNFKTKVQREVWRTHHWC